MGFNNKVAVLGSGSWATALVGHIAKKEDEVFWWIWENDIAQYLSKHHRNPKYLSNIKLPVDKLKISANIIEIIDKADVILCCIPAPFIYRSFKGIAAKDLDDKMIVSGIKGMVPELCSLVSSFFIDHIGISEENFAVISGPSHAEEVAAGKNTFLTIASMNEELGVRIENIIKDYFLFVNTSSEYKAVEYAGVIKNIMAIAVGIANGLGYGDNFKSVVATHSLKEMNAFIGATIQKEIDIFNSTFAGDLLVTAYSKHSRNRLLGAMIGSGYTVKSALLELNMVAEGYHAVKCIHNLIVSNGLEMPITQMVYDVLYNNSPPKKATEGLIGYLSR